MKRETQSYQNIGFEKNLSSFFFEIRNDVDIRRRKLNK